MMLEDIVREIKRTRSALDPRKRKDGYAVYHGTGDRVIRISRTAKAGCFKLKRVATTIAEGKKHELRFEGTFSELLAIIDAEVAIIEGRLPRESSGAVSVSRISRHNEEPGLSHGFVSEVTARPASSRAYAKDFYPEEVVADGVDLAKPFIYRWQIFDADSGLAGIYIGKAGPRRNQRPWQRVERYWVRVRGLQEGKPYSRKYPDKPYRGIHLALAAAVVAKRRIVLTYLCNIQPGEKIDAVESQLILDHASYGAAPHQLNQRP